MQSAQRASFLIVPALVCAMTASNAAGASVKIAAGAHEGAAKSVIIVPINVSGAPSLGAIEFDIVYDPKIASAAKVEKGALASNTMMESSLSNPGRVRVALVSQAGISGDGALVLIHFTGGASGKTAVSFGNARAWGVPKAHAGHEGMQHLIDVQAITEPGSLTIGSIGGGGISRMGLVFAMVFVVLVVIYLAIRSKRRAAGDGNRDGSNSAKVM